MLLSVIIVAKNEEKNISRCINSIRELASEIIVVDSGSIDRTVEIATELGAKVLYNEWIDYPVQVQYGIDCAIGDIIFVIDVDEEVSPELKKEIHKIITDNSNNNDYYQVNRKTYYLGSFLEYIWHPEWRTRLFRKGTARYAGDLHEHVVCTGNKRRLEGCLYHYSYKSMGDQIDRINKYARISAATMFKNGKKFHLVNLVGNPIWAFLKVAIRGVLEKRRCYLIAIFEFIQTFLKYAYLLEMELKKKRGNDLWQ